VLRAIAPKAARVTDKMPFNFLWAGLIHVAFPRASSSIAAALRSTRRCRSIKLISIRAWRFRPEAPNWWRISVLPAAHRPLAERAAGGSLHRGRLRGPDRAPEPVIRRIIAACGLAWHDACLRPESNPRAVKTPSKWQTRQPIYRTSVARWRRYEPWLGPLRALVDDGSEGDAGIARSSAETPSRSPVTNAEDFNPCNGNKRRCRTADNNAAS
jgi:hypothetical protein